MIKYFFVTLYILCFHFSVAQKKDTIKSETVAFTIIEDTPIFPGCENIKKKLQKRCFQNQIIKHVSKNFNAKLANEIGLKPGKTKLYVLFKIATDGLIKDIKASGEHIVLEEEGVRVIRTLPKMTPGYQDGKAVNVKYTLPIVLMVAKRMEDSITDKVNLQYISENIEKVIDKEESNLTNETVYKEIRKLGYKPKDKVKVITVFSIDEDGYVNDVRARGPHKIFEDEAVRIIKQLPKLNISSRNKTGVSREFTLPINMTIKKPKSETKNN